MNDIFVYLVDIPGKVREIVMPCLDGYTVYIDEKLDRRAQQDAYRHALRHIKNADFEKEHATYIELYAHEGKR